MQYDNQGNPINPESEKYLTREKEPFDFDAQSEERKQQILGWEAIAENVEEVLGGKTPTEEVINDSREQLNTIEKSEDLMAAQAQDRMSTASYNAQIKGTALEDGLAA